MVGRRVLKFGGAALKDGPAVALAARIVRERGGERPLVVASAHQGVTDLLERAAREAAAGERLWDELRIRHRTILRQLGLPGDLLDPQLRDLHAILGDLARGGPADRRCRDFVLSFGERMSARVLAAALRREGMAATAQDAFDLDLVHEAEEDGGAVGPPPPRVGEALARMPGVAVVTGFLAQDRAGNVVTLGRNGSDLSAAWFAEAIGAEEIQLWKSVAGVHTADPALVPAARTLPALSFEEAAELSALGAAVLHPGTAEPARRAGIPIRVLSVAAPADPGTRIDVRPSAPGPLALAHRAAVSLWRLPLDPGFRRGEELARILEAARTAGAAPWLVEASAGEAALVLRAGRAAGGAPPPPPARGELVAGLAAIGVVGEGAGADETLAAGVERTLAAAGVEMRWAPGGRSPRGRVLLVPTPRLGEALRRLHAALLEGACEGIVSPAPAAGPS
ncbi:MAG: aspartate kinase [Planctomycetota bacterium]